MRVLSMSASFIWEPLVFYRERQATPVRWWRGLAAPMICAALYGVYQMRVVTHLESAVVASLAADSQVPVGFLLSTMYGMSVVAALTYPLLWVALAMSLVCIDVLWVGSEAHRRTIELTGIAFYSQLPALLLLIAGAWTLDPAALASLDLKSPTGMLQLQASLAQQPLLNFASSVSYLSQAWLCILCALAYASVARIGAAATAGLATALYVAFFLGTTVVRFMAA